MKPQGEGSPPSQSEPAPKTLEELADQIHRRFIRFEDVRAPDQVETEAARAFATHYQTYLDLGGKPFETTKNWLSDLIALEQRCRMKVIWGRGDSTQRPTEGDWSHPMSKGRIKAALGLASYYMLDKLSKKGVYQLRRDPNNRQRWMIRLDTLDSETRQRFGTT